MLSRVLLKWYDTHRRDLPWRKSPDPYRIWLSEIMLQQTRVAAVIPYYERFLKLFPSIEALAAAHPQKVLHAWAGLGYYSRARSLHAAARQIAKQRKFPNTYEDWLQLPGIGPYTAAAISSIAFNQPHAVVDGNVRRVLSRLYKTADGFAELAAKLLDPARPGDFNQAMMELGATVCLPKAPLCHRCPAAAHCRARREDCVSQFPPVKAKRPPVAVRLQLALAERNGSIVLARPTGKGLWPRFWSLPELPCPGLRRGKLLGSFRHTVTYRNLEIQIFHSKAARIPDGLRLVPRGELSSLPISTPTRKALTLVADRGSAVQ